VVRTSSSGMRSENISKVRFSATLGDERRSRWGCSSGYALLTGSMRSRITGCEKRSADSPVSGRMELARISSIKETGYEQQMQDEQTRRRSEWQTRP
jgi:hypothetical protein